MERYSRRSVLAGAAGSLVAAAGCLTTGDGAGGTGGDGAAGSGDPTRAEPTSTETSAGPAPRKLEAVDVPGSPGGTVSVRTRGEVALLDFFATWCAPCKPQMSHLATVRESNPDLHMVSITPETDREAIAAFWRGYDGAWPVAMDPELRVTDAYGVKRIPTLVVLAPDGSEAWRHTGLADTGAIRSAVGEARA